MQADALQYGRLGLQRRVGVDQRAAADPAGREDVAVVEAEVDVEAVAVSAVPDGGKEIRSPSVWSGRAQYWTGWSCSAAHAGS